MRGLKIDFVKGAIVINPAAEVTGFDTTVQNALVNVATRQGTDVIYPAKGTVLLKNAVAGKIAGINDANHEAQLASLQTLYFSREYETSVKSTDKLEVMKMAPVSYDGQSLRLTVAFTDAANTRTVGTVTNL